MPLEGYTEAAGKVCRLKRSLYGIKQASRQWNKEFTRFLVQQGFQQSNKDYSLFAKGNDQTFIALLVYVDAIIITGNDATCIDTLKHDLDRAFTIKDLGNLRYFLGTEVSRSSNGIAIKEVCY